MSSNDYPDKPSLEYCKTGLIKKGEFRQYLHNPSAKTPFERCDRFYTKEEIEHAMQNGGLKKRRTMKGRRKQKRKALTRTTSRRYSRNRR